MSKLKSFTLELKLYTNTLPRDYRVIAKSLLSQLLRISNYVDDEEAKQKIRIFIRLMKGEMSDEDIRIMVGNDYVKYKSQINMALNEIKKLQNNQDFKRFMNKFEELYNKHFNS